MTKYCVDPKDIRHLEADGFGWGHDLNAGCLTYGDAPRPARRPGLAARLAGALTGRVQR